MDENKEKRVKVGRYNHYKGNQYDVYCKAIDKFGNQFVLYRESFGNQSFWIRPLEMFVEYVELDGEEIPRFATDTKSKSTVNTRIRQLIKRIKEGNLLLTHTETKQCYYIYEIDESQEYVLVHPINNSHYSGYLTDFELAERMGILLLLGSGEISHPQSL